MSKNLQDTEKWADMYFAFLQTNFGFAKVNGHYVAYEYNFGYRKQNIEIHVQCDSDGSSIPYIELHDYNQLSAMSVPKRYPLIDIEMPAPIKQIFANRSERGNRIQRIIPHPSDHLNAYLELWQADYDQHGKDEVEILIRENAAIIQRHPEILLGDLSVFPENDPVGDIKTMTTIEIRRPDGRMEKHIDGKKAKKSGIAEWLKSLLKPK